MLAPAHLVTALALVVGYLLGSIPFGLIATRLGGMGDIRAIGSGNIGATNVLRTGRRDLAAITLIGDGGKGAVAALVAWWFAARTPGYADPQAAAAIAGGAAFIGHVFPVWLRFRGGKGVATFFGVLLAVAWPVGLLAGATWIVMAAVFRYSSLAALAAALLAPLYAALIFHTWDSPVFLLAIAMAALIYVRHYENIRRLLRGQESKIGGDKSKAAA
ncbi:MAG TPA: glycerol-3-phosphate 1-O-acyltransferase PlsY [Caulobacteraceae bacterium]|nr:glycerol-3-phosphate 1-O-acyltransferase PlsY [Caulobacteraceae bacterium]